ncbi:MAG: MBL fold metallo-hydrolase [Ruminococcaceae bacterium]|nr:MBL fold metallo-hydrolase [Oscillospiraceae bacterium]
MKETIAENIFRLTIPFEDIYTTVYLIKHEDGDILFDTATYPRDIENYIIPFIKSHDAELKFVFLSHDHGDHAGGLETLLKYYPSVRVISRSQEIKENFASFDIHIPQDGEEFAEGFKTVTIEGHSYDSMGLLDIQKRILISGDSLQLYGIYGSGEWGANVKLVEEHIKAINKLRTMDIESIYAAHDYHPMGYAYIGKENITKAFDFCLEPLYRIKKLMKAFPEKNDVEIREIYQKEKLPTVKLPVFAAVRETEM